MKHNLPENTNLVYINCNLCGSKNERVLFSTGTGNIVKCRNCKLIYRNPRLSETKGLERYIYNSTIYEPYYEKINISEEFIFRNVLRKLSQSLSTNGYSPKLLDIGCSDGFFLELAQKNGFDIYGLEISKVAVGKARERFRDKPERIFEGTLKQANYTSGYFDIVTLFGVFDLLPNPLEEAREILRILKNNGTLIMRISNMNFHIPMRWFNRIIPSLTVFHLYGFTKSTIKKILLKAGFKNIKVVNSLLTYGDPYSQIQFHPMIIQLLKNIFYQLSKILYWISFGNILISPSLIVYAKK